uniref:Endonuclease V n=1 Tax=Lotharella oceanica TaxID=641309 RepID=A0A7S2TJW5_9EUKA|mmetsp:Transcript_15955/g.30276  ORF Transcript_15955/g.30276 Transcript_15955/m.30276 type:complete len:341 (+) Transcript_15955:109-1131(+)
MAKAGRKFLVAGLVGGGIIYALRYFFATSSSLSHPEAAGDDKLGGDTREDAKASATCGVAGSVDSGGETKKSKPDLEEIKKSWKAEQIRLKKQLVMKDLKDWSLEGEGFVRTGGEGEGKAPKAPKAPLRLLGGVDISFVKDTDDALASLVVLNRKLEVVYEDYHRVKMTNPYIPGFLAFREVDSLLPLFEKLKKSKPELTPDITLVDGNGVLHYEGFGLASHLGVLLGAPTIGIGKKLLCVDGLFRDGIEAGFKTMIQTTNNNAMELKGKSGRVWGLAVRSTKKTEKPIYVSVGHGVSLETAKNIVLMCSRHRIPEPVRQADLRSRDIIRKEKERKSAKD